MRYLSAKEILVLHDLLIEASGGTHGIRDIGLLQAAVMRPQTQLGGTDAFSTVFEKAAAYLDSIANNHMFIDGNKRTAFESAAAFLHFNGYVVATTDDAIVETVLWVVTQKPGIKDIAERLKEHTKKENGNLKK